MTQVEISSLYMDIVAVQHLIDIASLHIGLTANTLKLEFSDP